MASPTPPRKLVNLHSSLQWTSHPHLLAPEPSHMVSSSPTLFPQSPSWVPKTPAQNPPGFLVAFGSCDIRSTKLFTTWPQLPFSSPVLAFLSPAGLQSSLSLLYTCPFPSCLQQKLLSTLQDLSLQSPPSVSWQNSAPVSSVSSGL